jgi:hypothetical protein
MSTKCLNMTIWNTQMTLSPNYSLFVMNLKAFYNPMGFSMNLPNTKCVQKCVALQVDRILE